MRAVNIRSGRKPKFSITRVLGELADSLMLRILFAGSSKTSADIGDTTLSELRTRQINDILTLTPIMVLANIVNSSALVLVFEFDASSSWPLISWWFATVILGLYFGYRARQASKKIENRRFSPRSTGVIVRNAFIYGLVWAYPLAVFTPLAEPIALGAMLALTGVMVAGGSIALYPVPLAAFAFTGTLTLVGITTILLAHPSHLVSWIMMALAFFVVTFRAIHHHSKVFLNELISLLQMSEKRTVSGLLLKQYEDNSDNWIWECDEDLRLTKGVRVFSKRLGVSPDIVERTRLTELMQSDPETDSRADVQMLEIALTSQVPVSGLVVGHWDGKQQQFWKMHAIPQHDHKGSFTGHLGFTIDVTKEEASAKRIEYLATRDAQTGLLNKTEFLHLLSSQIEYLKHQETSDWIVSLAFVDSDGLKAVNDTFGHAAGDAMIAEIASQLTKLSDRNALIARIGGDEFLVAEFHQNRLPSQIVSRNVWLTSSMTEPFEFENMEIRMSVSCGLSISEVSVANIDRLMQQADRALYHIKQHGGAGCLLYEDRVGHPIARRRELSMDIGRAIRNQEFSVDFQPIVDTKNFSIIGYEALARWTRRDGTEVSPEEFITAAEESGQIVMLGGYVLEHAISLAVTWEKRERISVNVSVLQLQYRGFVDELCELLEKYQFPSKYLMLEIVENNLLQTNTAVQEVISRIEELGVALAFDDFGKGYSSFAYLTDFKVSYLKIDKSMTANLVESEEKQSIIRAIVGVARAFDLKTVAEGVETAEQFKIIRAIGCDAAQGYLIGLPSRHDSQLTDRVDKLRPLLATN